MMPITKYLSPILSPIVAHQVRILFQELVISYVHFFGRRKAYRYSGSTGIKLNIGSGDQLKPGMLNLDYAKVADIRLDLRRPLPFANESCDLIFSEHFIEHLSYPEGVESFLGECFRLLCHGGSIKISVPDTLWPLNEFCNNSGEWIRISEKYHWHPEGCTTYIEHLNYHFRQRWRGESDSSMSCHRFAFDFETLEKRFLQAGFIEFRQRLFDEELDNQTRKFGSLFVQAKKP